MSVLQLVQLVIIAAAVASLIAAVYCFVTDRLPRREIVLIHDISASTYGEIQEAFCAGLGALVARLVQRRRTDLCYVSFNHQIVKETGFVESASFHLPHVGHPWGGSDLSAAIERATSLLIARHEALAGKGVRTAPSQLVMVTDGCDTEHWSRLSLVNERLAAVGASLIVASPFAPKGPMTGLHCRLVVAPPAKLVGEIARICA